MTISYMHAHHPLPSSSPYLCSPFNMHPRQLTAAIGEAHPQAKKRGYIYILSSRYLWYTPLFHFTPLSYMVVPLVCVLNRVLTNITHLRTKDAHDRSIFSSKSVFSRVWKYIFGYQFKGNIVFYDDFNFNANLFFKVMSFQDETPSFGHRIFPLSANTIIILAFHQNLSFSHLLSPPT
jgi:hypothetical protein